MRKVLNIILDYFVIFTGGAIIGLFIYSQYANSICLVAGKHFPFTREILINGLFKTLPVIYIVITVFIVLYKIRHRSAPCATFITYCSLSLFTWLVLFPLTLTLQKTASENLSSIEELRDEQTLSSDYFRKTDGAIYYFIKNSDKQKAEVFQIIDPEFPESFASEKELDISKDSAFYNSNLPFRDPILKDSMTDTPFGLIQCFYSLKEKAKDAWNNGYIAWLCFASLGFALSSVYAFIKFSSWRMINAYLSVAFTGLIIWFNYFYFTSKFDGFRSFLYSLFYDGGKLGFFVNRNIDFPLTLINLIVGILLSAVGIVIAVLRNQEER